MHAACLDVGWMLSDFGALFTYKDIERYAAKPPGPLTNAAL